MQSSRNTKNVMGYLAHTGPSMEKINPFLCIVGYRNRYGMLILLHPHKDGTASLEHSQLRRQGYQPVIGFGATMTEDEYEEMRRQEYEPIIEDTSTQAEETVGVYA